MNLRKYTPEEALLIEIVGITHFNALERIASDTAYLEARALKQDLKSRGFREFKEETVREFIKVAYEDLKDYLKKDSTPEISPTISHKEIFDMLIEDYQLRNN